MHSLHKNELIGIVVSVLVMVVVLYVLKGGFPSSNSDTASLSTTDTEVGTVVVSAKQNDTEALKDALLSAVSLTGELNDLVITEVQEGSGNEVKNGDTLSVNYIGVTRDGVQFDSSYERGTPFVFTVGERRVIEGWEKGFLGMKEGGQRILIIPSDMAYGNRAVGSIAPNSVLIFSIELVEIL